MTRAIILWSERPLPEWHSGASHKGSTRASENVNALRQEQMEAHGPHLPMALRHASRQRRSERNTKKR